MGSRNAKLEFFFKVKFHSLPLEWHITISQRKMESLTRAAVRAHFTSYQCLIE